MGKRHGACIPPLRAQLFSKLHMFINLEASESCPFGCLLRSHFTGMLIKSSLMTTNSTFRPSALTRDQRGGTGYINPLITWVVLLQPVPILSPKSNSHVINITKDTCVALYRGNSKSFRSFLERS